MSTEVQVIDAAIPDALTTNAILAQVTLIHAVMTEIMIKDTHYGIIPGTGAKPSLLKAGAEKLLLTFRLDPQYESTEHFLGDHLFVRSRCTLYHQTSGRRMGSGEGSCSTKEAKYAYRQGHRLCPHCGKDTIIKGKQEYGGGWLCFGKKGGCGAKWPTGAVEIESQNTDRILNEDLADQYNTVLKMANKRSLIAAVLNVTAASDIFTQDVEDMPEFTGKTTEKPADGLTPAGQTVEQVLGAGSAREAPTPSHAEADAAIAQRDLEQEYRARFTTTFGADANKIQRELVADARLTHETKDRLYKDYAQALKTKQVK
jgi:hypothetical protein